MAEKLTEKTAQTEETDVAASTEPTGDDTPQEATAAPEDMAPRTRRLPRTALESRL